MRRHSRNGSPLALVRSRRYDAGVLGHVTPGGAWVFLLPSLELRRVQVVGRLDPGAIEQLRRLASQVDLLRADVAHAPPADLLVLAGVHPRRLSAGTLNEVVGGTLAAGGVTYVERNVHRNVHLAPRVGADAPAARYVGWPPHGALMGAAPLDDATALGWLAEHGLVLAPGTLEQRLGAWMRRGRDAVWQPPRAGSASGRWLPAAAARRIVRSAALAGVGAAASVEQGWQRLTAARRDVTLLGAQPGTPQYLTELAGGIGGLTGYRTALVAAGHFRTQKNLLVSFPPEASFPALITKVGREPAVNERLDAAVAVLEEIHERSALPNGTVPEIAFAGTHAGLRFVGERTVAGRRFDSVSTAEASCPWATRVVDALTRLGRASRQPVSGSRVAEALQELLDRSVAIGSVSAAHANALEGMLNTIGSVDEIGCVVQHGDPGTWNIVARDDGSITILDWENGESLGMPFWDLAYFARSFGALIARRHGIGDRLDASLHVLRDPALRAQLQAWSAAYAVAVGLPERLIGPLFYHGLVYQALKEASRLPRGHAARSIFARTLGHLLEHDRALVSLTFEAGER